MPEASEPADRALDPSRGRLAFITPRFGDEVVGGSEAVMREAASGLAGRGWEVDVLTTCARDHYTWRNEYPAGITHLEGKSGGLTLRRFPAIPPAVEERDALGRRILLGLPLSYDDQCRWINATLRVPALFRYFLEHADRYQAVVLSPYLSWITVACVDVAPKRTVLMPCVHDESYAHLDLFRATLAKPALLWFLSEPEYEVARGLAPLPEHVVTGAGVEVPASYDPRGFRRRHGVEVPFVLYAGRREPEKGWDRLMAGFELAVETYGLTLDLVTIGAGKPIIPSSLAGRVRDLGFLSDAERNNAFAAAEAYLQPSTNESFSRTVMESWLAGTPVIASARGAVVAWHCERSRGGLVYEDDFELAQCLLLVEQAPRLAKDLAANGRAYVLENYPWNEVLDRMEHSLKAIL
ncbi:MAG: glycosyltransferase family 4 protein [Actinobacteria bacterium]|nr:MAG: glycosyltransferase family 4 protein [Actinomycetota bacterium]